MEVNAFSTTPGATIVGYIYWGAGPVEVWSTSKGLEMLMGRWGEVWPYGYCENRFDPSTDGSNYVNVDIDVETGGTLSYSFEFKQYAIPGWWDSFTAYIVDRDNGLVVKGLHGAYGNPAQCWGRYWSSPRIPVAVDLSQWAGRRLRFVAYTADEYGQHTDARAYIHTFGIRDCKVPPLSPMTNEDQLMFEDHPSVPNEDLLATDMKAKLACLRAAVAAAGESLHVTSGYRTETYQHHLWETWYYWDKMKKELPSNPECQQLLIDLQNHVHFHEMDSLKTAPARTAGLHPQGLAFDARWYGVSTATLDALADGCGLCRPMKKKDKRHFELLPCRVR